MGGGGITARPSSFIPYFRVAPAVCGQLLSAKPADRHAQAEPPRPGPLKGRPRAVTASVLTNASARWRRSAEEGREKQRRAWVWRAWVCPCASGHGAVPHRCHPWMRSRLGAKSRGQRTRDGRPGEEHPGGVRAGRAAVGTSRASGLPSVRGLAPSPPPGRERWPESLPQSLRWGCLPPRL